MDLKHLHFLQGDIIYNIPENEILKDKTEPIVEELTVPVSSGSDEDTSESKKVNYSGNSKAKVYVLIEDIDHPVLNEADETFLFKIMGAVKHSKSSIVLVNVAEQEKQLVRDFLQAASPEIIIAFGVLPAYYSMKADITPYESYVENDIQYFPAATLSAIQENISQKKKLWEGLQLLFKLKKQP